MVAQHAAQCALQKLVSVNVAAIIYIEYWEFYKNQNGNNCLDFQLM